MAKAAPTAGNYGKRISIWSTGGRNDYIYTPNYTHMKNIFVFVAALFLCSHAFSADKKQCDGENKKTAAKPVADTPVAKKQTAKNSPAPVAKDNSQKAKKEPANAEGGFIAPLSWRPVLVY
jgi:hypothetical protein